MLFAAAQASKFTIAARNGHFECVQLLCQKGKANVEAVTNKGLRAIHCAALSGSIKICKYLIETGECDVNAVDSYNRTAFYIACQEKVSKAR